MIDLRICYGSDVFTNSCIRANKFTCTEHECWTAAINYDQAHSAEQTGYCLSQHTYHSSPSIPEEKKIQLIIIFNDIFLIEKLIFNFKKKCYSFFLTVSILI